METIPDSPQPEQPKQEAPKAPPEQFIIKPGTMAKGEIVWNADKVETFECHPNYVEMFNAFKSRLPPEASAMLEGVRVSISVAGIMAPSGRTAEKQFYDNVEAKLALEDMQKQIIPPQAALQIIAEFVEQLCQRSSLHGMIVSGVFGDVGVAAFSALNWFSTIDPTSLTLLTESTKNVVMDLIIKAQKRGLAVAAAGKLVLPGDTGFTMPFERRKG